MCIISYFKHITPAQLENSKRCQFLRQTTERLLLFFCNCYVYFFIWQWKVCTLSLQQHWLFVELQYRSSIKEQKNIAYPMIFIYQLWCLTSDQQSQLHFKIWYLLPEQSFFHHYYYFFLSFCIYSKLECAEMKWCNDGRYYLENHAWIEKWIMDTKSAHRCYKFMQE